MKHVLELLKGMGGFMGAFAEAVEKDEAERKAEWARMEAESRAEREQMRQEAEQRRKDLLEKP